MIPFSSVGFDASNEALAVLVQAGYVREFPSGLDEILEALRGLGATGESVRILREAEISDVNMKVGWTLTCSARLPSPKGLMGRLHCDPAATHCNGRLSIDLEEKTILPVLNTLGLEQVLEHGAYNPHTEGFPASSTLAAIRFAYITLRH